MFIDLERKRRSIRKYQDKSVETEKIDQLVEAALLAPSSRAIRPWEFIVVQDKALLQKLAEAKSSGGAFLSGAPLAVVVCADTEKSDAWIEDAAIASTMLLLEAESLDLGACWVQIRNRPHDETKRAEEFIREVLLLPDRIGVLSVIGIGYPDEVKPPYTKDDLLYGQVHDTQYGKPWPAP